MYITNADLEFLIDLQFKLLDLGILSDDYAKLYQLNKKLFNQKIMNNEKTCKRVAMRRKIDKYYARPKNKGIE